MESGRVRIGELSRRAGVSAERLRAWEQRYGLLQPERTPGGFRLYSAADERRVRLMQAHLAAGLSAAEAARLACAEAATTAEAPAAPSDGAHDGPFRVQATALGAALRAMDEPAANGALDRLLAEYAMDTVLGEAVLPCMHAIGEDWERARVSVAQEHFASTLLEGRLLGLARGWGSAVGPRALLACPTRERHTIGLIAFGLTLHRLGWRITYLGADTPLPALADAAERLEPDVVVIAASEEGLLAEAASDLAGLAGRRRVVLGGPAAGEVIAGRIGAELLPDHAIAAARMLAGAAA